MTADDYRDARRACRMQAYYWREQARTRAYPESATECWNLGNRYARLAGRCLALSAPTALAAITEAEGAISNLKDAP